MASDIVERLRNIDNITGDIAEDEIERISIIGDEAAASILALRAEIERLNQCLKWEQHRAEHIGTHSLECHAWGPQHYECLMREFDILRAKIEADKLHYINGMVTINSTNADLCRQIEALRARLSAIEAGDLVLVPKLREFICKSCFTRAEEGEKPPVDF